MKKILIALSIFLLLFSTLSFVGCEKKNNLSANVSVLRKDILFGENENYKMSFYLENREAPHVFDGEIGEFEKAVIIKLQLKNGENGSFAVSFATDKTYTANFSFTPVSDCYTATVKVEKLPDKSVIATISHLENSENLTLNSLLKSNTVSPDEALQSAYKHKKDYVDSLTHKGAFRGEIGVRLIVSGEKNFWYVGFITKEQTVAVLIDGETGKALQDKTILNR